MIGQTEPASLAFLRYVIGVACLAPLAVVTANLRFARRDLPPIAFLGMMQFGLLIALMNYGLQHISAARGALIFATFPILTLILSTLLGRASISWTLAAGVVVNFTGVALTVGEQLWDGSAGPSAWQGVLAVAGSALIGALCSVLYRPYLTRYGALPVSTVAMLASVILLGFMAAGEGLFREMPVLTGTGWLAVLFIGVGSGAGYYLWLWALGRTSPTRVAVFLSLSPVTAALLGALWLSEPISPLALAGLVCIGVGLWLAHRVPREATADGAAVAEVIHPSLLARVPRRR